MKSHLKALKASGIFMQIPPDFIKYCIVGGAAFVIDFSLLVFFTEITGLHYLLSAPIAFIISLVFNYLLCINWVFQFRVYTDIKIEFLIFITIGVIGIVITEFVLWVFTPLLNHNYMLAKILAVGIVLFWNYLMRKYLLFKDNKPDHI
jgi:putative flippase GtrA